jgi:hypothetical protein
MKETWIVMAHRSGASVLGEAHLRCKQDGEVIEFSSKAAAEFYAEKLNKGCQSSNVHYTVEPFF